MSHRTPVDPYLPGHGDDSYAVEHYDLDLEYAVDNNVLSGRATLSIRALQTLDALTVDLHELKVVKITGVKVKKYTHSGSALRISLASKLREGDRAQLTIAYRGVPKVIKDRVGEAGWEELTDGVLVAAQPGGAPTWFPCNDRVTNKATYTIRIAADQDYTVVSNGLRTGMRRRAGKIEWTYEQRQPMAPYQATVQIGRYVEVPMSSGVPMSGAVPPARRGSFERNFHDQPAMMDFFCRLYGPYPYDVYRVVITDEPLEIPLESTSLSTFGTNFLTRDWDAQRLIAHELSHQWFGNTVTMASLADIWLHEGFACYSEWLWSQESGGPSTVEKAKKHYEGLEKKPQDIVLGDPSEDPFDDRVYKRGALTVHAIRCRLGDRRFFEMLRAYVETFAGKNVTTQQFQDFAEQQSGMHVDDIIDRWVRAAELPPFPH